MVRAAWEDVACLRLPGKLAGRLHHRVSLPLQPDTPLDGVGAAMSTACMPWTVALLSKDEGKEKPCG